MSIYRKSLLALLLVLSSAAHAVDTSPSITDTAPAKPSAKRKKCDCKSPSESVLRKAALAKGLDPKTVQGQMMLGFFKKIFSDPELNRRLLDPQPGEPSLWDAKLSAPERLRNLQLMKTAVTATPNDCKAYLDSRQEDDSLRYLSQMSPVAVLSMLDMLEISIRHKPSDDETSKGGTIEERLETHKFLVSALKTDSGESPSPQPNQCERVRLLIDHVNAAPEPMQSRASLALLRYLERQPSAVRLVLRQPEPYLNEAFDERVLPEWIRGSLPPDGSRPLPFKRAVFDTEMVNKATPASSQRFTSTLINRRDNGVVAAITVPATPSEDVNWTQFSLVYGTALLRSHYVEPRLEEPQANLQDAAALVAANQPLKEGATLRIPLPQPDSRGEKERVCTVGSERPASTVFSKLTGSAIDLHCKQTTPAGEVTEFHDVWLVDYQSDLVLSVENQYGKNEFVIRDVTVQ
ncbi:hypothetical protein [Ralstonia insidiosa]|uniref:hypothetical protein n=1 Tax=Ralstonia insidiosa TaxID=190721 RepID=UPI000CEE4A75|nr:hypothetical protein [Ralstonia insidiosa]